MNTTEPLRSSARGLSSYPWRRLLLSVLFLAFLSLAFWAVVAMAVVQFVLRIFDEDASEDLRRFGLRFGRYMGEIVAYAVFAKDTAPFPFSRFPDDIGSARP